MTTILSGEGFGGTQPQSAKSRALASIDADKYTFVNKDFVRNIQWLNESVSYLSDAMAMTQRGVDEANQNVIEQVQGFWADLFVLFAGGEPTGINLGDIKYVIQGLGALLGINPDTPFPLNLFEASWNIFTSYIVPLPQFTDVIFDAIIAWAEELGFTDEAVDAMQEFSDAVVQWYQDMDDFLGLAGDMLKQIFSVLGLGGSFGSLTWLGDLWGELYDLISNLVAGPKDLIVNVLSTLLVIVFKALTFLVKLTDPMQWCETSGINSFGPELVPLVSDKTTDWNVVANPNAGWVWDTTYFYGTNTGCLRTNCNALNKRLLMQNTIACTPGKNYRVTGELRWSNISASINTFGPVVVWYSGANEVSQTNIDAAADHGPTAISWVLFSQDVTVPQNVDGFRIGARVTDNMNTGLVRVGLLSCTEISIGATGLLSGIAGIFGNIPFIGPLIEMFAGLGSGLSGLGGLTSIFSDLLGIFGLDTGSGLGSGNVSIPSNASNIPILGPVIEMIGEIPIVGPAIQTIIDLFFNLFTGGTGTGNPLESLVALFGNIPVIGQIVQMFVGLTSIDDLGGGLAGLTGLENVPLLGPVFSFLLGLVNGLVSFLGGTTPASGDNSALNTLFGLLENIPLVGTILQWLEPIINPLLAPLNFVFDLFGGAISFIGSLISGLLSFFSFGLLGGGLGGIEIGGPGGAAAGLGYTLEHTGLISTSNKIPTHTLSGIAPGQATQLQPDPEFDLGFQTLNGQGRWWIDFIAPGNYGHTFCTRTVRRGLITVYMVEGTMSMTGGMPYEQWKDPREYWEAYPATYGNEVYDHFCDTTKFELVRVPYVAALFPLQGSVTDCTQKIINMIRQVPGPFILWGASLGTIPISNVLDELRFGTLKDRYDDLLLGLGNMNIRREQGTGFPDKYHPGQYLVYDTQGFGVFTPVLTGTKVEPLRSKWWELSFPAGPYAAYDNPSAFNAPKADPFSAMPDNQVGRDCRAAIQEIKNKQDFSLSSMGDANDALMGGLSPGATGHGYEWPAHQPWLVSHNDHQTYDEYCWEKIRSFGDTFTPPEFQDERELEGVQVPVKDGQIVLTGAAICWMGTGIPVTGEPAIAVRCNVFDANHHYLETLWSDAATFIDPASPSQDWLRVQGEYLVSNDSAKFACISLWTSDACNKTTIVWFAQCTIETDSLLDAALLGNMENAAHTFIDKVGGAQGETNLVQSMKTLIDGLASAASQTTHTNVTYAEMFDVFQDMTMTAYNSMDLGQQNDTRLAAIEEMLEILGPGTYHPPETINWPTPGQYVWTIPLYARGVGTQFDTVLLAGGGGAGGKVGIDSGQGGDNANFTKVTLTMGGQIPTGTTQLVINVGVGGLGGAAGQNGHNGTDSYIALVDNTIITSSAGGQYGGKGNTPNPLNNNWGDTGSGPGNTDFFGQTFFGGTDVGGWGRTENGSFPGGGGSAPGGNGASGKVWIALGRTV